MVSHRKGKDTSSWPVLPPDRVRGQNGTVDRWLTPTPDGTLIRVWLVPGSSRDAIDGVHGDAIKVRVTAPPERGRANAAAVDLLEGRLGFPVRLVGGRSSRRKTFEVAGAPPSRIHASLIGHSGSQGD